YLGEFGQTCCLEPRYPDAFPLPLDAHTAHPVVPVADPHEGQSVTAEPPAVLEGPDAVVVKRCRLLRHFRTAVVLVLVLAELRAVQVMHHLVEDGPVARDALVEAGHVRQEQEVVGETGPDAASRRRMPPVLDIAFGELPSGGTQDVS